MTPKGAQCPALLPWDPAQLFPVPAASLLRIQLLPELGEWQSCQPSSTCRDNNPKSALSKRQSSNSPSQGVLAPSPHSVWGSLLVGCKSVCLQVPLVLSLGRCHHQHGRAAQQEPGQPQIPHGGPNSESPPRALSSCRVPAARGGGGWILAAAPGFQGAVLEFPF